MPRNPINPSLTPEQTLQRRLADIDSGRYPVTVRVAGGAVSGEAGPAGAAGSVWFTASGAPAGGTGVVGDFYLNSANGDFYKKTGVSTWTLSGNIKGATGSTGAPGTNGTNGTNGPPSWTPVIDSSIKDLGQGGYEKVTNVEGDATLRSAEGFVRGCYITWKVSTTNKGYGIGLNSDPATDEGYTGIDYFFNVTSSGTMLIRESGTEKFAGGSVSAGDILSITYDGVAVRYWKNGELILESLRSIGAALYLDSWWNNEGGKIESLHFGPMGERPAGTDFTPVMAPTTSFSATAPASFEKIATGGLWDAGVSSLEGFVRGCFVTFKPAQTNKGIVIGLNTDPTSNNSYTTIDYGIYLDTAGNVEVYDSGFGGVLTTYTTSDIFSITYDGANVRWWKNNTLLKTKARAPGEALYLDSSFSGVNAKVENLHFGPMGEAGGTGPEGPSTAAVYRDILRVRSAIPAATAVGSYMYGHEKVVAVGNTILAVATLTIEPAEYGVEGKKTKFALRHRLSSNATAAGLGVFKLKFYKFTTVGEASTMKYATSGAALGETAAISIPPKETANNVQISSDFEIASAGLYGFVLTLETAATAANSFLMSEAQLVVRNA